MDGVGVLMDAVNIRQEYVDCVEAWQNGVGTELDHLYGAQVFRDRVRTALEHVDGIELWIDKVVVGHVDGV